MIKIKMFSDYIWPYCYIGKGIVEQLKNDYEFEIEPIGFEIHPETPKSGVLLSKIFPNSENSMARLKDFASENDIEFGDLKHLYNTHNALKVGELAKSKGLGNIFSDWMFKANFVDGLDIYSEDVLIKYGLKSGLSEEDIKAAIKSDEYDLALQKNNQLGRQYDIKSVPTFIINDTYKIVGSQSKDAIQEVFDKILAEKN